jgi:hypothetical protein
MWYFYYIGQLIALAVNPCLFVQDLIAGAKNA